MKESLSCPNCLNKVRVDRDKIPPSGAWAVCPFCREKFFIPAYNVADVLEEPVEKAAPPKRSIFSKTRAIDDRPSPILADVDLLSDPGRSIFGTKLGYSIMAIGVVALIAALILIYNKASHSDAGEPVPAAPVVSRSEYGFPQVKADLLYLRRKLFRHERYNKVIDFRGVESRLFKHVQTILAPNACAEISSLKLTSQAPRSGFVVRATCSQPKAIPAEFEVKFLGGWAVVFNMESGQ
ncbi:MAG: zinc-ribbon domain-containing protein, partial [Deltaproteobacteria bacterium]|nr:zinc-ribbon domain-containing protein [Deltaproteobacteria bacterium]